MRYGKREIEEKRKKKRIDMKRNKSCWDVENIGQK
jgi:hypothetical protein